jgi:putative membrane protein
MTLVALVCAGASHRAIRRNEVDLHRRLMMCAIGASAVFLVVFVFRYYRVGPTEMRAGGVARLVYLFILTTHEALAVAALPTVLATAAIRLAGNRQAHRDIARIAFPIWMYVMVTGLVVYAFLYV